MDASDSREIERKYGVTDSTPLPPLRSLPGVGRVQRPRKFLLEATYFDTSELSLAEQHITLRRRTGGDDAGWHLKLPLSADERRELHEPLGENPEFVPVRFRTLVAVHVRGRAIHPVVLVRTRRTVRQLLGPNEEVLGLFCDDEVDSERLLPTVLGQSWREWELELLDGDSDLLDAADALFAAAGVYRSDSASKLAHAVGTLGARVAAGSPVTPPPKPPRPGSAGELLIAALREYRREWTIQDVRVRTELPDSVHRMRVALARIRNAVGTFHPLLGDGAGSRLRSDLRWMGHTLGAARDADLLAARLADLLRSEAPDLVLGPIAARIALRLGEEADTATSALRDALDSPRYFRLLDDVDALCSGAMLSAMADGRAKDTLPALVDHLIARLRAAARSADQTRDGADRDLALHEVRKKAKKVRYAAELASASRPKRWRRIAKSAEAVQDALGGHHDTVVARQTLLRLSADADQAGESSFSYGRLHAAEERLGDASEAVYDRAVRRIPKSVDTA